MGLSMNMVEGADAHGEKSALVEAAPLGQMGPCPAKTTLPIAIPTCLSCYLQELALAIGFFLPGLCIAMVDPSREALPNIVSGATYCWLLYLPAQWAPATTAYVCMPG